jgi:hypothetical protein
MKTLLSTIAPEFHLRAKFRTNSEFQAAFLRELAIVLNFEADAEVMPIDLIHLLLTADTEVLRMAMQRAATETHTLPPSP